MRSTAASHRRAAGPRALVVARQAEARQPTAVLATLGLITALLLTWFGMVSVWPGLH